MSLNEPHRQALGSIEDGLAGSDPKLASMLNIFSRLAAGEGMPAREKDPGAAQAVGRPPSSPHPAAPALGQGPPATAPAVPAPGLAAGHAAAVGGHLSRAARRRAGPQQQRPQGLHPVDGNSVPLPLHPTARRCVPRGEPAASRRGLPAPTTDQLRNRSPGPTSAHDRQHRPARQTAARARRPAGYLP